MALYYGPLAGFSGVLATEMGVTCLTWLALALCFLGYPEQALARGREAIILAGQLDMPVNQGRALSIAGCGPHICWRQRQAVQTYAVELLALAQAKDLLLLREWVEIALGWCQVEAGEFEPGIARIVRGTRSWQQMGTWVGHFWHLGLLAEAYAKAGEAERGLVCIEEGLALVRRIGYSQYEPELYRVKGELLQLKVETEAEAEACFWRAIEVARRQETRWWELRAVIGLARLGQARKITTHRQQVRAMLVNLVAWFDEGADLPDLIEAQTLLQALSPEPD